MRVHDADRLADLAPGLLRAPAARVDRGLPGDVQREQQMAGAVALPVDRHRFGDGGPRLLAPSGGVERASKEAQRGREVRVPRPQHSTLPRDEVLRDRRDLGCPPEREQVRGMVVSGDEGLGMVGAGMTLTPGHDRLLDGRRLGVSIAVGVRDGQALSHRGRFPGVFAPGLDVDGEGLVLQSLRRPQIAVVPLHAGDVPEQLRDLGAALAATVALDGQGLLVERSGGVDATLVVEHVRELGQRFRRGRAARTVEVPSPIEVGAQQ